MQRLITFGQDRQFTFCWMAYLAGARPAKEPFSEVRADGRIQAALETVSVPVLVMADPNGGAAPVKPPRGLDRTLRQPGEGPRTLTLAQDDFERLLSMFETAKWLPDSRREAVEIRDWLATAPAAKGPGDPGGEKKKKR